MRQSVKYAPRLVSKMPRIKGSSQIPIELRREIEHAARMKGCSMSWIMEQIILDWADIRVDYVKFMKARKNGHR
jgi:hypothetical protein